MIADARRSVSRKYGFRQSSYINFKVEGDYFFCLYFLSDEARLTAYSQPATAKLLICRKKTSFGVSKFSFLRGLRLILC